MEKEETLELVRVLLVPILQDTGAQLIGMELISVGNRSILRICLDKEGGIKLDECAYISRTLGDILDVEDPIEGRYTLEVSSPGLDRPLECRSDFVRTVGKKIDVSTGSGKLSGTLIGYNEDSITLKERSDGGEVKIMFEDVVKAKLSLDMQ